MRDAFRGVAVIAPVVTVNAAGEYVAGEIPDAEAIAYHRRMLAFADTARVNAHRALLALDAEAVKVAQARRLDCQRRALAVERAYVHLSNHFDDHALDYI